MPAASPGDVARAFAAAVNAGDLAGAMSLWTDRAIFVAPNGGALSGKQEIAGAISGLINSRLQLRIDTATTYVAGATAIRIGSLTISGVSESREKFETTIPYTTVYERAADGSWCIAIDAPGHGSTTPSC